MIEEVAFIVEGPDDEAFFRSVILPYLRTVEAYESIDFHVIVSHGFTKNDYRKQLDLYDAAIVVLDLDADQFGCPLDKKNHFCSTYELHHVKSQICVVIAEIEAWYLAVGYKALSKLSSRFLNPHTSTESITKEIFEAELRSKYPNTRQSTLKETLLQNADITAGVRRNSSIKYLLDKVQLIAKPN